MEQDPNSDISMNEELQIRASSIIAMGRAGDRSVIQYLKEVIEDRNEVEWLRACAAIALGRISGEEAVSILFDALQSESGILSRAVIIALRDARIRQAIKPLQNILEDQNKKELHALVINAIGTIGGRSVSATLIQALENTDVLVRRSAALELSDMRIEEAMVPFMKLIGDGDECLRTIAASALGLLGDSRAADTLITALNDAAETVRTVAASSLGYLGEKRAIPPLEKALGDRSKNVSKQAAVALSKLKKNQDEPV